MTTTLDLAAIDYSDWMKAALSLAGRGSGLTHPNPAVGAIVLDPTGEQIGSGFHQRAGEPHAEVLALAQAGTRARGGTLIVTLEPCCHTGRTPPCTDLILRSGLRRVVATHTDPDPRVAGLGFETLRQAGVEVVTGVEVEAAEHLNRQYLHFKRTGLPWVTLKLGTSLDGKIADAWGRSRWITSPECRRHAHALRAQHAAILVGANTARSDDPDLSLHGAIGRAPQRFVLVGRHDLPETLRLFHGDAKALTIGNDERSDWVVAANAQGLPDPSAVLERLGKEGFQSLLVEGGGRVVASFLALRLAQQVVLYVGYKILGDGHGAFDGVSFPLESAPELSAVDVESLPGGLVISGRLS